VAVKQMAKATNFFFKKIPLRNLPLMGIKGFLATVK
jgi:hypothetical protein